MSAAAVNGKEKEHGRGTQSHFAHQISSNNHPETAMATFVPNTRTKSGSTNLSEGTVHVYRESISKERPPIEASTSSTSIPAVIEEDADEVGGIMLAVMAVPAWMTPSDFLAFVAPAAEGMAHLRMIRLSPVMREFWNYT